MHTFKAVNEANGQPVKSWDDRLDRWKEHFNGLLNQQPPQVPLTVQRALDVLDIDCHPPSLDEVRAALNGLKRNKAAGPDGIPAGLLKESGQIALNHFAHLLTAIWATESIPEEWENALLIPLHKKGSRAECSNYRGIAKCLNRSSSPVQAVFTTPNSEKIRLDFENPAEKSTRFSPFAKFLKPATNSDNPH